MNIILFGIKGCGKTTFGKKIAVKLNRAFIDTDSLVETLYQIQRKKKIPCRDIFKELGAVGFRSLEYEAIQSLQDVQNSVISVGGGAMTLIENVEFLSKNGLLFYLVYEKEALRKRVLSQQDVPVFLDPNHLEASFDRMYDERDIFYRKLGAKEIDVTKMKDNDVIETICTMFSQVKQTRGKSGK